MNKQDLFEVIVAALLVNQVATIVVSLGTSYVAGAYRRFVMWRRWCGLSPEQQRHMTKDGKINVDNFPKGTVDESVPADPRNVRR